MEYTKRKRNKSNKRKLMRKINGKRNKLEKETNRNVNG